MVLPILGRDFCFIFDERESMSQKKIKQLKRQLKILILRTPASVVQCLEHTIEVHYLDGKELKEEYDIHEIDGVKVVPGVKYRYNYPVIKDQNFLRRLRRAFESNGMEGVNQLYNSYHKMMVNNGQKDTN